MKESDIQKEQIKAEKQLSLENVLYIGCGYVGSISAITMASINPQISFTVFDIDSNLISKWNTAAYSINQNQEINVQLPFFEPQLIENLKKALSNDNIQFKSDNFEKYFNKANAIFICVNTPPLQQNILQDFRGESKQLGQKTDMRTFIQVVKQIGQQIKKQVDNNQIEFKIIVNKSTVPIGTSVLTENILKEEICVDSNQYLQTNQLFTVVSMPEFLAEGQAVQNLLKPDRIVIGSRNSIEGNLAFQLLKQMFNKCIEMYNTKIINVREASSEIGKLLSNAMLAQRISSINSMTSLTEKFENCCINEVKQIIQADPRIGDKYLNPSPGFGGSCFEKDLLSLIFILDQNGERQSALYWQQVLDMNRYQKERIAKLIAQEINQDNKNKIDFQKSICVFGFSYKKNTSDTRLSQSAFIINYLANIEGFNVNVHDPRVTQGGFILEMEAQGYLINQNQEKENCNKNSNGRIQFFGNDYLEAVKECQSIIVLTEWDEFQSYDYKCINKIMKRNNQKTYFYDMRSYLDSKALKEIAGFDRVFKLGIGYY